MAAIQLHDVGWLACCSGGAAGRRQQHPPTAAPRRAARRPPPTRAAACSAAAAAAVAASPLCSQPQPPRLAAPAARPPPAARRAAARRGGACWRRARRGGDGGRERVQNPELMVGDCLCLLCFALYKQITALIFLPSFPGWLAPLAFNPARFLEFFSFAATLLGTWVAAGMLTGGYRFAATADVPAALRRTCYMWLASMPVAAAQLVLLTAAEGAVLVGDEGFASRLPLAATGAGEPFVTAAGVLGLMLVWRTFYSSYLDMYSFRAADAARRDRVRDMETFADSLRAAMLLSLAACALLQLLGGLVGEEQLELMAAQLLARAGA